MPEELKNGWRRWRFDQMAVMVNERIDDPAEAGVDHYVGLEHLDSDSLIIRRWGSPSDVEATKLRFRKGDIIFGRRRVYQRKLAVAHFDGICSAHAMVLRAKPNVILPAFLPFFMQSDMFMDRAKEISVGSLSPTINWKTLAQEEFALPSLKEQQRTLSGFGTLEDAINAYFNLANKIDALIQTQLNIIDNKELIALKDLAALVTKGTTPTTMNRDYVSNGIPFLRAEDILNADVNFALCEKYIDRSTHESLARSQINPYDVLLTIAGTVGRVALVPGRGVEANCNQAVAIIRFTNPLHAEFLAAWLQSTDAQNQMHGGRVTGTISNLSLNNIKNLQIPILGETAMHAYCQRYRYITNARVAIQRRVSSMRQLKAQFLTSLERSKRYD